MSVFEQYGLDLLLHFEGLYLKPYLCPAGVPTIGLGSTRYACGRAVTLVDPSITRREAIDLARRTYERDYLAPVMRMCPHIDNDKRIAAIVDFCYNLGVNAFRYSTLKKRIDEDDWEGAKREILRWNKSKGKALAGLTARRLAEASLL